jgi:hypothetical protein
MSTTTITHNTRCQSDASCWEAPVRKASAPRWDEFFMDMSY